MKGVLLAVVACTLLTYVCAIPTQLTYQLGQQYIFSVAGVVDSRGSDVTTSDRTPGSSGFLTSTMVMEPVSQDTSSYTFVMNMFNTVVSVNESVSTPSGDSSPTPMGYDMYFQQHINGTIMQIWYNTADSPFYVNVKISSINSFQTHLVNVGESKVITESDVVGLHSTNVAGSSGENNGAALLVTKTFNQDDISEFVDPSLTSKNVVISANGAVGLHSDGYAVYSFVQQLSTFVNSNSQQQSKRDMTNSTGFDMNLSSLGTLTHTLTSVSTPSLTYPLQHKPDSDVYVQTTLTGGAATLAVKALKEANTISNLKAKIVAAVEKETSTPAAIVLLAKVGKHIRYNPEDAQLLLPYLRNNKLANSATIRDRVFYVLTVAQNTEYITKYGLLSKSQAVRARAILACAHLEAPTREIIDLLHEFALNGNAVATNVFGICVGKANDFSNFKNMLANLVMATTADDESKVISWLNALGNAGPVDPTFATSLVDFGELIVAHKSTAVRAAAAYALRKYTSPMAANLLREFITKDSKSVVAKISAKILLDNYNEVVPTEIENESFTLLQGSDFPFNKSFDKDITLGGSVVGATFSVDLIAGTNFDCSQPTFNYEVSAVAKASASLFGVSQEVFDAQAIYGKDNGAPLADMMQLSVWGDVIYSKTFPQVDCSQHTYPIAHASPGYSVSYTLWVSIVPIVFTADLSMALDLQWGWQVCDAQLSAMVELIPSGSVVATGSITIDLLLLRAGVELQANFNEEITPSLYIHGSQCALGLEVDEDAQPMDAAFTSYYEWRECKFLIFDCHWGQHNQQNWWSWTRPAVTRVLFDQEYKIAP